MSTGPKIVHQQFNSPIGLYSQQNIQETLNKHIKNLDNGSVGIDFNNSSIDKPANLANSAVLRMLEEEERVRRGYPSQKKVVWPPVPETNGYHSNPQQNSAYYNNTQHSPSSQPQSQYQTQPQYQPQLQYQNQYQHQPQSQPHYQIPNQYQAPLQSPQSQPSYCEGRQQEPTGVSKLIPANQGGAPTSPYRQGPPSPGVAQPYRQSQNRWAPVPAPLTPQPPHHQQQYPQQQQYQQQQQHPPQQQYPQQQQYQQQHHSTQQQQYSEPDYHVPQKQFEPPPSTITLRSQPPIHQKPSPVFLSQPVAASFKGGVNMRGDQKWPPQSVKEAVAAENEARIQLAKGPACRPRKVKKDYSSFFAKHALNHSYPGYRVPPGTQHYEDYSGRSSY